MIEYELSPITSKDGTKLHVTTNETSNPKAGLVLVHGLGEHIGRYDHVYKAFEAKGILVYGMDLRGHGRSEGKKGHASSYECLMDDIEELLKTIRSEHNDLALFLFGHSMGGNLAANYVIENGTNELKGFIISSPWLALAFEPPRWQTTAAQVISKVLPSFAMDNNLDANHLSKIPEVCKNYIKDPLVTSKISAGLYVAISQAGLHAMENAHKIKIPGLIYHGTDDHITNHDTTKSFAAKNDLLTWVSFEGVKHEGHNDTEQEMIIATAADWVLNNLD
jgi:acylglycerol lipase